MSGGTGDDDKDDIAPSFEEQVKFLRKSKKGASTRFQKTTEYNVSRKLKRELADQNFDQAAVDNRLDAALNREAGQDIFGDSLAGALIGKKAKSSAPRLDDDFIVGQSKGAASAAVPTAEQTSQPVLQTDPESQTAQAELESQTAQAELESQTAQAELESQTAQAEFESQAEAQTAQIDPASRDEFGQVSATFPAAEANYEGLQLKPQSGQAGFPSVPESGRQDGFSSAAEVRYEGFPPAGQDSLPSAAEVAYEGFPSGPDDYYQEDFQSANPMTEQTSLPSPNQALRGLFSTAALPESSSDSAENLQNEPTANTTLRSLFSSTTDLKPVAPALDNPPESQNKYSADEAEPVLQELDTQPDESLTDEENAIPPELSADNADNAETIPAETISAETIPAETIPAETIPAETNEADWKPVQLDTSKDEAPPVDYEAPSALQYETSTEAAAPAPMEAAGDVSQVPPFEEQQAFVPNSLLQHSHSEIAEHQALALPASAEHIDPVPKAAEHAIEPLPTELAPAAEPYPTNLAPAYTPHYVPASASATPVEQSEDLQAVSSSVPAEYARPEPEPQESANYSEPGMTESLPSEQSEQQIEFSRNYILRAIEFKEETGFDLVLDDKNTINLVLNAGGESLASYAVEFSESGVEEAKVFATTLIEQYVNVLSTDFGIEFGQPGEIALRQLELVSGEQLSPGKPLLARMPRIDELKALHRAIEYSWPATFQLGDQLPLRVVFLNDTLIAGEDSGAILKYMEDGCPMLFISPALGQRGKPTETDPSMGDDYESWQASIMREFAWKTAVDCNKFPLSADDIEMLGWVPLQSQPGSFALKTAKGQLFRPYDLALIAEQAWVRCDEGGALINKFGKTVVQETELGFLGIDEMAHQAAVHPAGEQFFNAEEEIVDALRCFRQGADHRAHLAHISPVLYRIAKSLDQLCINRCYAPSKTYAGLIRSAGGSLVDNNAHNQRELLQFEQKLLKQT